MDLIDNYISALILHAYEKIAKQKAYCKCGSLGTQSFFSSKAKPEVHVPGMGITYVIRACSHALWEGKDSTNEWLKQPFICVGI